MQCDSGCQKRDLEQDGGEPYFICGVVFLTAIFMMDLSGALAQTTGQGALQGTITDSTDAVIPNASVRAVD